MDRLQEAVELIKAGDKEEGKRILIQVVRSEPRNEQAWLWLAHAVEDPEKRIDCLERVLRLNPRNQRALKMLGKSQGDEPRPFIELVQVWLKFFRMSEDFLVREVQNANNLDTFTGVFVYTVISVLFITLPGMLQLRDLPLSLTGQMPDMDLILIIIFVGSVVMTPISFYLSVGINYLGARIFGGTGNFSQQAYLQSLIIVPMTLISGVVTVGALIPYLGFLFGLVGFGLSIYTFILNLRAIKVVHDLTTGRAVGSVFAVPLIFMVLVFCLFIVLIPFSG